MTSVPDIRQDKEKGSDFSAVLALAALFEGVFSVDWLQELFGGRVSKMLNALDQGVQEGWLVQSKADFFHFTDDQARLDLLRSLPEPEQSALRRHAAEIILRERSRGNAEDQPSTGLFLRISNNLEGCRFLFEQGTALRKSYRYREALKCFEKALGDLEDLNEDAAEILLLDTTLQYSKVSTATSDTERVIAAIEKAIRLAESEDYLSHWILLKMNLAKHEWLRSNFQTAVDLFDEGWKAYMKCNEPDLRRPILVLSTSFQFWKGHFQETISNYETLAPEIEDLPSSDFPILTRQLIGLSYAFRGQVSYGLSILESLRKHCLERNNLSLVSHITGAMAEVMLYTEQYDGLIENLEAALKVCQQNKYSIGMLITLIPLACVCYSLKKKEKAIAYFSEFLKVSDATQIRFRHVPGVMHLCWAIEKGELPPIEGLSLEKEIDEALNDQSIYMRGIAYYFRALLKKKNGRPEVVIVEDLKAAMDCLSVAGHEFWLAKVRFELARINLKRGQLDQAKELADQAAKIVKPINTALIPEDLSFLVEDRSDRNDLLNAILKLSQEMIVIRDSRELTVRIISTVIRITGAERGALLLYDDRKDRIWLRAAKNLNESDLGAPEFEPSYQIIEKTVASGQGIVKDFQPARLDAVDGKCVQSCICVPLILRERVIGVLYCDNSMFHGTFKNEDIELFNYFAAQAAIALDNAKAYASLEEIVQKQKEENRYLEEQYLENVNFEDIIGKSKAITRVFNQIESVSGTDSTVLILGETGVGKELVARAIHRNSDRRNGPFVRVNCSVFSEHLIASELFGHEKGAFTGAIDRQIGRFELAHKGTIFLDEIGDMPLSVQVQLLRVIQNREFERVGGRHTISSDFRLMAATNRNLEKGVEEGRFRKDLFYRLSVFPIQIPPLRERKDDIPALAYHFLRLYSKKFNKFLEMIPHDEMQKLLNYPWPGNVRELENIMERGSIVSSGSYFTVPKTSLTRPDFQSESQDMSMTGMEKAHILRVIKMTNGKVRGKDGAAEVLKIHPNTLYSRMKKLGISVTSNRHEEDHAMPERSVSTLTLVRRG